MIFDYPLIFFYQSMVDLSILCCAHFRCRAKVIVIRICVLFFRFFSVIGYDKICSIVPCVIQKIPVAYSVHFDSSLHLCSHYLSQDVEYLHHSGKCPLTFSFFCQCPALPQLR